MKKKYSARAKEESGKEAALLGPLAEKVQISKLNLKEYVGPQALIPATSTNPELRPTPPPPPPPELHPRVPQSLTMSPQSDYLSSRDHTSAFKSLSINHPRGIQVRMPVQFRFGDLHTVHPSWKGAKSFLLHTQIF